MLKPAFENSHAILIEKALGGLDLAKAVDPYVGAKDKVALVSIERSLTGDYPVNYVIEDCLIANLVASGMSVLERDEDLLARLLYEQGDRYQRIMPDSPSAILLRGVEGQGMGFLGAGIEGADPINPKDAMDFFGKLGDYYRELLAQVKIANADVLVSYRVLECGIMVEKEAPRRPTAEEKSSSAAPDQLKVNFKRDAMARLAVRVVDAKTGEIRWAGILEGRAKDTLVFEQEKGSTEYEFLANVAQYQEYLENFHYTFYDQQLPNLRGTMTQQQEIHSVIPDAATAQTGK